MRNQIVRVGDAYLNMTIQVLAEGKTVGGQAPLFIEELFSVCDEDLEYIELLPTAGGSHVSSIRYYRDGRVFAEFPRKREIQEMAVINGLVELSFERAMEKELHGGLDGQ